MDGQLDAGTAQTLGSIISDLSWIKQTLLEMKQEVVYKSELAPLEQKVSDLGREIESLKNEPHKKKLITWTVIGSFGCLISGGAALYAVFTH